uniref:Putative inorganic phosphate cotransporter n=1 Tax=Dendroctonus ponderosae TaxID=77166 RepID=J3JVG4_DENPD|nr:unknown [Dendroctonus ponderosae]
MTKQVETKDNYLKKEVEDEAIDKGPIFGCRHVQALLLFCGITVELMTRLSLSLSIVAMTKQTSENHNIPTYDWKDSNLIISSFYWGYLVFQLLAGQLSKNYGSRWILFGAMGINSFATIAIPMAAHYFGSEGVMAFRILQGLSQGGIFPTCYNMLGRWAPKNERARIITFVYSGMSLGTIVCFPITGIISASYLGWPASFYLFGGLGFVWSVVWIWFGHNSPASHPSITPEEKRYIEVSLNQEMEIEVIPTPWKQIFTSVPFWACAVPTICSGYGVTFLQNEIPTYLENVLKYDISSSGYLTAMTVGVSFLFSYIYGLLSDFLIERNYLSRTHTRKFFEGLATYGSAIALITLGFLDESNAALAVFMFTLTNFFLAGIMFGHAINIIDISPRFSGIVLGFANSTSCLAALSAPLSVQYIVTDLTNVTLWRWVFILAALTLAVPATFFEIFASADRQWWDDGAEKLETVKTVEGNIKKISKHSLKA